ncbi:MAG TPA: DNA polymerase III subunit delta [Bacteroidota bacterium]|nr:DNA polymerase III subunit delta [Bacteroidota bacterium]
MPESSYKDFQRVLQGSVFAPVYLFYGEEDFLIQEAVETIVRTTLDDGTKGFNLDIVYGSQVDAQEVVAHANSFPMMSAKRVVVVREFEKLVTTDAAKECVTSYIQRPLESTLLILVADAPDFRRKPFNELRKKAEVVFCPSLYDNQVPGWISNRIQERGKTADLDACRLLHAYVGTSLRSLQNEIDKLFIFVGDRPQISPDDVTAVVGATKGFTIFDLQNAIGRKDSKEATVVLERMMELGESPQMMIVMLTRFFLHLYKLSELRQRGATENEMAGELRISPYFVKSYLDFSTRFTVGQIEHSLSALAATDANLKSSSVDPLLALEVLLHALVRGTAVRAEAEPQP